MQALKAGCLLLAVAFAIDIAAFFLHAFGGAGDFVHALLLAGAAHGIGVLSLACFARAEAPQHGFAARRAAAIFWALIVSSCLFWVFRFVFPLLDFEPANVMLSLAFLALWAAFGWAVGVGPLDVNSPLTRVGPFVAGIGSIVSLIVALALSWGSFFGDRGEVASEAAGLLALLAVALSFGGRQPSRVPVRDRPTARRRPRVRRSGE